MNKNKRRLLLIAVAVCLVSVMALGSLAYFTAQDNITNTFMTATYDPENPGGTVNPDDLFSIQVLETADGELTNEGKTYEGIQPGDVLAKDPTVKNTGDYSQWVRVHVTLTNAANWQAICVEHGITDLTTIFGGFDSGKWTLGGTSSVGDTLTYTYYLNSKLEPDATATLFNTVTIPAVLTIEDMVKLSKFELTIAADAIQSKNTGDSAKAAFDA